MPLVGWTPLEFFPVSFSSSSSSAETVSWRVVCDRTGSPTRRQRDRPEYYSATRRCRLQGSFGGTKSAIWLVFADSVSKFRVKLTLHTEFCKMRSSFFTGVPTPSIKIPVTYSHSGMDQTSSQPQFHTERTCIVGDAGKKQPFLSKVINFPCAVNHKTSLLDFCLSLGIWVGHILQRFLIFTKHSKRWGNDRSCSPNLLTDESLQSSVLKVNAWMK